MKHYSVLTICAIAMVLIAVPNAHAQETSLTATSSASSTSTIQAPVPPSLPVPPSIPVLPPQPERPMPILFDASTTMPERSTSSQPLPPVPQHEDASGTHQEMNQMPPKQEEGVQEDIVLSSTDTPAARLRKLAKYWAVYREIGSEKMYALTTSGTKREIQTLAFFTKIDSNFGMRLMPKGSLDQFTTGDAITSVDALDISSFRKLAEPCRLVKTADKPVVYLACLGIKRAIQSEKAFRMFGWDFKQVQTVGSSDVGMMKDGEAVSETTVFDQGIQIDAPANPESSTGSMQKKGEEMKNNTPAGSTTQAKNTRVVKLKGDVKIFVISADGKLHRVLNMDVVRSLKLDLSKVQTLTEEQFKAYSEGEPLSMGAVEPESMPKNLPAVMPPMGGPSTSTNPMPVPPTASVFGSTTTTL